MSMRTMTHMTKTLLQVTSNKRCSFLGAVVEIHTYIAFGDRNSMSSL